MFFNVYKRLNISQMAFKAGDLVQTNINLIGEVVSVLENTLEVYFLVPDMKYKHKKIWIYKEEWDTIKKVDVVKHVIIKDKKLYPKYYKEMGFKAWDGKIFTRTDIDIEKDEDLKTFQFPTGCDTEDEEDDYEYDDWCVKDAEAFTFAEPTNDYVKDTHKAVRDFNKWEPKNKSEKKMKTFVEKLELKFSTLDDDFQFKTGTSLDYKNPPMAPRAAKRHKSFRNK